MPNIKGNDLIVSTGGFGESTGGPLYTWIINMDDWKSNPDGSYYIVVPRSTIFQIGDNVDFVVYKKDGSKYYRTHNLPGEGYIGEFDVIHNFKLTVSNKGRFEGKIIFSGAATVDITETGAKVYERIFSDAEFEQIATDQYRFTLHKSEYYRYIGSLLAISNLYRYDSTTDSYYLVVGFPQTGYRLAILSNGDITIDVHSSERFSGKIVIQGYNTLQGDQSKIFQVTLSKSQWYVEQGCYKQTVSVPDMIAGLNPSVTLKFDESNLAASKIAAEEFSKIAHVAVSDGEIRAYCLYSPPTSDIVINVDCRS